MRREIIFKRAVLIPREVPGVTHISTPEKRRAVRGHTKAGINATAC
jgi:hypothetical protein